MVQRSLPWEREVEEEVLHKAFAPVAAPPSLFPDVMGAVERGERNVSLVNILKLARALKAAPSALFEGMR